MVPKAKNNLKDSIKVCLPQCSIYPVLLLQLRRNPVNFRCIFPESIHTDKQSKDSVLFFILSFYTDIAFCVQCPAFHRQIFRPKMSNKNNK